MSQYAESQKEASFVLETLIVESTKETKTRRLVSDGHWENLMGYLIGDAPPPAAHLKKPRQTPAIALLRLLDSDGSALVGAARQIYHRLDYPFLRDNGKDLI
jgi:hypothetical protein